MPLMPMIMDSRCVAATAEAVNGLSAFAGKPNQQYAWSLQCLAETSEWACIESCRLASPSSGCSGPLSVRCNLVMHRINNLSIPWYRNFSDAFEWYACTDSSEVRVFFRFPMLVGFPFHSYFSVGSYSIVCWLPVNLNTARFFRIVVQYGKNWRWMTYIVYLGKRATIWLISVVIWGDYAV